jgi:uncharacterized protein
MSEDAHSADWSCPVCGTQMTVRPLGSGQLHSCPSGHGVFLARMDLGSLVESETDWHRLASQGTMPIPRITPDMQAPRTSKKPARAWVETLFS